MKRKFLNIISCFLALFIFVGSFLFCVPSRVSALSVSDLHVYYGSISDNEKNKFDNFVMNCYNFFSGTNHEKVLLYYYSSSFAYIPLDLLQQYNNLYSNYTGSNTFFYPNRVQWDNTNYTISDSFSSQYITSVYEIFIYNFSDFNYYMTQARYFNQDVVSTYNSNSKTSFKAFCLLDFSVPTVLDPETGLPLGLGIEPDDFYSWLVNNNKISGFPSFLASNKIRAFLDYYNNYGGSNSSFIAFLNTWLSKMNIVIQSKENASLLKLYTDNCYREYLNYVSSSHSYWPSSSKLINRHDIDTVTDDNNLTLVTDSANDSIDTSILRDILRGVIAISNNIINGVDRICSKLDSLQFTVTVANNGGSSSGSDLNPVLNKMDDIIDKIEDDTVSVEIDQTTKDDTDDFFDDWNLQFQTALNNKFPVAGQLSTLFTDFWEKCGVDADGDGETFEYYNPGVLSASVSRSGSAVASESDIVSDFLGNFDDADPAFLDDASFHGVPDLSVTVGGHSVSIIDFRVYAKYREKIHFIISFVIWTLYLLHLYKALPTIIGQVADVAVKTSDL